MLGLFDALAVVGFLFLMCRGGYATWWCLRFVAVFLVSCCLLVFVYWLVVALVLVRSGALLLLLVFGL